MANLPTNVDVPNQLFDPTLVSSAAVAAVSTSVVPATVKTAVAAIQAALSASFSLFDGRTPATGLAALFATAQTDITAAASGATTYGGTLTAWLAAVSAFLTEITTGTPSGDDNASVMRPLANAVYAAAGGTISGYNNPGVGGASPDLAAWTSQVTLIFGKIAAADLIYGLNAFYTLAPVTVLP